MMKITKLPKRILSWLTTAIFLGAFALILLAFDVLQRIAIRLSKHCHEIVINKLHSSLMWALNLTGCTVQVHGAFHDLIDAPIIIVSNHQSMFDIPLLGHIFRPRRAKFIAKKELKNWIPSVSFNLRHGGNAIIDRKSPMQSSRELLKLATRAFSRNNAVVLFPEGTRSRTGQLLPFHLAGLKTLLSKAPLAQILPVTICGTGELTKHKLMPIDWGTKINVYIGTPLSASSTTPPALLLDQCRSQIESALHSRGYAPTFNR